VTRLLLCCLRCPPRSLAQQKLPRVQGQMLAGAPTASAESCVLHAGTARKDTHSAMCLRVGFLPRKLSESLGALAHSWKDQRVMALRERVGRRAEPGSQQTAQARARAVHGGS